MTGFWDFAAAATAPAPAAPPPVLPDANLQPHPKPGTIPAADAWLLFRATQDEHGVYDGVTDLRVVAGRDKTNGIWREGPRDWSHDIPLLRHLHEPDPERNAGMRKWLAGDPETNPGAAWRLFCSEWRLVDPAQCSRIAAQVVGLEWLARLADTVEGTR